MWSLWWTKWLWDRFSEFFSFPLSISFHRGSPYSYIAWGCAIGSLVAAVRRHSLPHRYEQQQQNWIRLLFVYSHCCTDAILGRCCLLRHSCTVILDYCCVLGLPWITVRKPTQPNLIASYVTTLETREKPSRRLSSRRRHRSPRKTKMGHTRHDSSKPTLGVAAPIFQWRRQLRMKWGVSSERIATLVNVNTSHCNPVLKVSAIADHFIGGRRTRGPPS
jgi:hypothetical protein